jgi:FkbM family methyltransferase
MGQKTTKGMSTFSRYLRQVRCFLNARRLGFFFVRIRSFKMPAKINIGGVWKELQLPQEKGADADFLPCFVRNIYGLRLRLGKVQTILDIGSNVGMFSMAARMHYPKATIHAYEPNPRTLPFLRANTAELGIKIYAEAVGAESGHVLMLDRGSSTQARTVLAESGNINQTSLDTAVERLGGKVDLLKMDCEGAEWEMFKSPSAWPQIRNVRMEYHLFHGETVEDVEAALVGLGFKVIHWESDPRYPGYGIVWAAHTS